MHKAFSGNIIHRKTQDVKKNGTGCFFRRKCRDGLDFQVEMAYHRDIKDEELMSWDMMWWQWESC